jgi:hypothetical protein
MINAVADIGAAVRGARPEAAFFVDAMSSFGGMPLDLKACSDAAVGLLAAMMTTMPRVACCVWCLLRPRALRWHGDAPLFFQT